MRGTVKWYDLEKGYGFIAPDGGPPNIFVQARAITRAKLKTLREGDRVEFAVVSYQPGRARAEKSQARQRTAVGMMAMLSDIISDFLAASDEADGAALENVALAGREAMT